MKLKVTKKEFNLIMHALIDKKRATEIQKFLPEDVKRNRVAAYNKMIDRWLEK